MTDIGYPTSSKPAEFNPIELVVLQGNSLCNLNCTYCDLSVQSRRARAVMDLKLVERLFSQLFESGRMAADVTIVWHSGEPLTLPPSYYDEAIGLVLELGSRLVGPAMRLRFRIQTNGVLIDEAWCALFRRHAEVLDLGVSCDGPADLHDAYRVNWNGRGSFDQTLRGMDLLQRHGIKYKVIAVTTAATMARPKAFFDFFLERRRFLSGFHFNVLAEARSDNVALAFSVRDRDAYYAFYRSLLDLCRQANQDGHDFEIQNFSQGLERIVSSGSPAARSHARDATAPFRSLSVDAAGNVTTFYAGLGIEVLRDLYDDGKGLSIGNILETPFRDMVRSEKLQRIVRDFEVSERACRASCAYYAVCPGGYELTKQLTLGTFDAAQTTECTIHVKTLVDALLDDIHDHATVES